MNDKSYSKSECLKYQGVTVFNDVSQKPCDGQYMVSDTIVRFRNGLLHGGKAPDGLDIPAYETETGDIVRKYSKKHNGPKIVSLKYNNGLVNGPAVISDWGDWEEWWNEGELILIRARSSLKTELEKKENS